MVARCTLVPLLGAVGSATAFGTLCGNAKEPSVHPEAPVQEFPPAGTKAAFLGDAGSSDNQRKVLELVKDWGAEFVIHGGDYEYKDDAALFEQHIDAVLGPDYPYFADIGNHDVRAWTDKNQPGGGHYARLTARLERFGGSKHCAGEYGVNMVCNWKGLTFVLSGVGTYGDDHVEYINRAFDANPTPWRMCNWHKNQRLMQVGSKFNEVGWGAYEACREQGAIIATHHEHSYCRSKNMKVTGPDPESANDDPVMTTFPGQSFVFVSGLAGHSIRPYLWGLEKNPWWAASASLNTGVGYGAILCTFHVNGNPREAECEFRDVAGKVWDSWTIRTRNGEEGAPRRNGTGGGVPRVVDIAAEEDFGIEDGGLRVGRTRKTIDLNGGAGYTFSTAKLAGVRAVLEARLQVYGAEENAGIGNVTICGMLPSGAQTKACAEWSDPLRVTEFGEKHEVWVSADLASVVNEMLSAGATTLTLHVRGSGASRVAYASEQCKCLTPHLWTEVAAS